MARLVVGPPRKLSLVRPFQDLDGVGVRRSWGPQRQLGSGSHQRPSCSRSFGKTLRVKRSVMAELRDALELLTDPSCLLHVDGPMAQMRAVPILAELQARGADLPTARALVQQALEELGGENRSHVRGLPVPAGGPLPGDRWVDQFWVPVTALRAT